MFQEILDTLRTVLGPLPRRTPDETDCWLDTPEEDDEPDEDDDAPLPDDATPEQEAAMAARYAARRHATLTGQRTA